MRMVPQVGERINYERGFLLELRMSPLSMVRPYSCDDSEVILHEPIIKVACQETATYSDDYFSQGVTTRHIITGITLQGDVTLHTSEKPWKPGHKDEGKTEKNKNLEAAVLFIMNRLTPSNFEKLAEEMRALEIKTYNDLELVVNVVFDKVSLETKFVQAYAALCKVMLGLQVEPPPSLARSRATFRAILVSKCQQTFEADKRVLFEDPEQTKSRIKLEMPEDTPARAEYIEMTLYHMKLKRLKFFGNISFIGELFKLGILPEVIIHSCITRLLGTPDEESLLSFCKLMATVGKHIDTKKAKQQVDKYFARIIQLADASKSRLKFSLKDIIDLRKNKWTSRNEQAAPTTIAQLHRDFKEEQAQVQTLQSCFNNQQIVGSVRKAPQQRQIPQNGQPAKSVRSQVDNKASREPKAKSQESGNLLVKTESDKENDKTWSQVNSKAKTKGKKRCSSKTNSGSSKPDKHATGAGSFPFPEAVSHGHMEVSEKYNPQTNANINSFAETESYFRGINEDEGFEDKLPCVDIESLKEIDTSRLKLSRTTIDDDIKLVPGGGRMGMSFSIFRSPTNQEDSTTSHSLETNFNLSGKNNRFSLLHNAPEGDEHTEDAKVDHHDVCLQAPQHTKRKRRKGKGCSQKIQTDLRSPDLHLGQSKTSRNIASDAKFTSTTTDIAPALEKIKGVQLTLDELELRCKDIIDEYLNCRDEMELQQCVKELVGFADMSAFVTLVFNHVLEKSNDMHQLIGEMFDGLVRKKIISVDEFIQGFSEIMAVAQDMVIDIPMLWAYLAQLMTPMLGQSFPWAKLDTLLIPHVDPKSCSLICAHILRILLKLKKMVPEDMSDAWTQTGLEWTQFMEADKVASFLADHEIDRIFLTSQYNYSSPSTVFEDATSSPSPDVTIEQNEIQPSCNTYPNQIYDVSEVEQANTYESHTIFQTKTNKTGEDESCNDGSDSVSPICETSVAISVINQADSGKKNEIVHTDSSQIAQALSGKADEAVNSKDAIASNLSICETTGDSETAIKNNAMIGNCEISKLKSDEAVSCGATASNPSSYETVIEISANGSSTISPAGEDDLDEEGEALWRKEMEEDEMYFTSCFVQCQGESSEKKFIICCFPSFGYSESEEESHCDTVGCQIEAGFEDVSLNQCYSDHFDVTHSQARGLSEHAEVHAPSAHIDDAVSSYTPWSADAEEHLLASNLSVDAPAFIPSILNADVFPPDLINNKEYIINDTYVNCENSETPAECASSEGSSFSYAEHCFTARKHFPSDLNPELSTEHLEFMHGSPSHEQDTEMPVTFSHNLSQNPASHFDQNVELGWSFRSRKRMTNPDHYNSTLFSKCNNHSSILESLQAHATFPSPPANSAIAEVAQESFLATRITHSPCADPMIIQSCDANQLPSSRSLDHATLCSPQDPVSIDRESSCSPQVPVTLNTELMDPLLYPILNKTNTPNIIHRCKLAMCDLANLLRRNCSDRDLLLYIEIQIFNTELEKFALSMFMTVIGYTALTAMNAMIIKERRDVLAFLIKYDPELELEAIKALHFVMTFVPKPLGIINLYNALYTEGLVSHEVLLRWSISLTTTKDKRNFVARTVICALDYVIANLKANSEC